MEDLCVGYANCAYTVQEAPDISFLDGMDYVSKSNKQQYLQTEIKYAFK